MPTCYDPFFKFILDLTIIWKLFVDKVSRCDFQPIWGVATYLFPPVSAIEGIKSVLSVCQHSPDWTVRHMDLKIWWRDWPWQYLGWLWGSRSKVARLKNVIFWIFRWVDLCRSTLSCHMMSCDVTAWSQYVSVRHPNVIWRLWVRILTRRARRGRTVNAQAFSWFVCI